MSVRTRSGLIVPGVAGLARPPGGLLLPPKVSASFDPLSIGWSHVHWVSGPKMLALGLSEGGAVASWPDEVTTNARDLSQSTAGARPTFRAAHASFGGKPVLEFDGTSDFMISANWSAALSQANYIYMVARTRNLTNGANQYFSAGNTSGSTHITGISTTGKWRMQGNNGAVASAGNADTLAHALRRVVNNFANQIYADETLVFNDTSNLGVETIGGLGIGARGDGAAGTFASLDIAFWGIKDSALTAQEILDLRAWSQAFYATP